MPALIGNIDLDAISEISDKVEGKTLKKPWKALKASTLRQKAAAGFGSKGILERTGTLRKGFAKKVSRFKVRVFNPVNYFKFHQLGTPKLPKRIMITSTENLKQDIIELFRKPINKILNK